MAMKPNQRKIVEESWDYHEVIDYIEKKYNIDVRDYAKSHEHFPNWLKLVGENPPNYPICPNNIYQVNVNGVMTKITKEEYDIRFKEIHDQYKRFKNWCDKNPEPPYLDFWHWYIENHEIHNGCYSNFNLKYYLNNSSTPEWIREITQLIYNEFQKEKMKFWIEW